MVCPMVPRLGFQPKLCLARPMLFAALDCYDKRDYIGAGVRLREAVDRFVKSACEWYGVEVTVKFKTPKAYARALYKAKHVDEFGLNILVECIDTGNKLAHCDRVDHHTIKGGIAVLFSMMDGEPYCGKDRQPLTTPYKGDQLNDWRTDDDDDHGDDWKQGVQS